MGGIVSVHFSSRLSQTTTAGACRHCRHPLSLREAYGQRVACHHLARAGNCRLVLNFRVKHTPPPAAARIVLPPVGGRPPAMDGKRYGFPLPVRGEWSAAYLR